MNVRDQRGTEQFPKLGLPTGARKIQHNGCYPWGETIPGPVNREDLEVGFFQGEREVGTSCEDLDCYRMGGETRGVPGGFAG